MGSPATLTYGFSTKRDGNIDFRLSEPSEVHANRATFLTTLGLSEADCVAMRVEASDTITVVDEADRGRGMQSREDAVAADALVTTTRGIGLLLPIADCLPIILFDPAGRLALVHAGWKGTDLRIASKTVAFLRDRCSVEPSELQAIIGPGIQAVSYTFENPVQRALPDWKPYLQDMPDGETSIDLFGFNRQQLIKAGLEPGRIEVSQTDTARDETYFSHYRTRRTGEAEGRFMTVAALT